MVPAESLGTENQNGENRKHEQGDDLLYDFELDEREGSSVLDEPQPVGRHLKTVFEKGDSPTGQNDEEERKGTAVVRAIELQVSVPRHRHEGIGTYEQQNGIKRFHGPATAR